MLLIFLFGFLALVGLAIVNKVRRRNWYRDWEKTLTVALITGFLAILFLHVSFSQETTVRERFALERFAGDAYVGFNLNTELYSFVYVDSQGLVSVETRELKSVVYDNSDPYVVSEYNQRAYPNQALCLLLTPFGCNTTYVTYEFHIPRDGLIFVR